MRREVLFDRAVATGQLVCSYEHRGGFGQAWETGVPQISGIALGSLTEVAYVLRFALDAGVLDQEEWYQLDVQQQRASIATWKLY